ncbi:MAG TPA: dehydrogenase [Bacteroidales bacterium]|nr:dehydrogenase [Bacteroidales bacterium]
MTKRRDFIKKSTLGAAGIVIGGMGLSSKSYASVTGANDEIRIALVGCGGRGSGSHIPSFGRLPGVKIVAVCDPDRERMSAAAQKVVTTFRNKPAQVPDVRKLMERKDFDAVTIATMQYWHSLPAIRACETGRHVFVEKPLAHFIWEGRQMVNAARKYDRIVQVGTQNRSIKAYEELARWLREGHLGKILHATCFCSKPRQPIGKRSEPLPIPETLDYDLWCGYADNGPIYRDRIQYDCSFTWDKGDGESVNQGVHEVDIARWMLGYTGLPRRTMSIGGRFLFDDAGDVPNTQIICYDYPDVPILYVVYNLPKSKEYLTPEKWNTQPDFRGAGGVGVSIQCEGGYTLRTEAFDLEGNRIRSFSGRGDHYANFVDAMRSGRREDLNAEIIEGHRSTNICHVGNISYRMGATATLADQRRQVADGDIVCWQEMYNTYVKYLDGLGVDPVTSILGPWLECDSERECIKNNPKANEIVKGFYRKGYEVPETGW